MASPKPFAEIPAAAPAASAEIENPSWLEMHRFEAIDEPGEAVFVHEVRLRERPGGPIEAAARREPRNRARCAFGRFVALPRFVSHICQRIASFGCWQPTAREQSMTG